MEQSTSSLTNVTSFLPSPADLLLVLPRLLSRAGSFAEHLDSVFGKIRAGGSIIAEPTASNLTNATIAITSGTFVQESLGVAAAAAAAATGLPLDSHGADDIGVFQALRNVGTIFSYITSKWAIATFATAILLNRTHFYASSRVPLSFDRIHLRIALYILPTILFVFRIQSILQAIRCQTSPSWSEMQYGALGRDLDTDYAGDSGVLFRASSALLFWESADQSCMAVNMAPVGLDATRPSGSLALLWPLFLSLGFSQFIETLSCALQGRQPVQEVGMTIFEHSLAFAEAEAVVTKPLILDTARFWKPRPVFLPDGTSKSIGRAALSKFANVPPEVLLISLISSFSHLTSNLLAIMGVRPKLRLVTTGIWGFAYMSAFAFSILRFASNTSEPGHQVGILRIPTVCIVGFIPHLLILFGIVACGTIYLIAFGLTVLSPPPGQPESMTWRERCAVAYGNLHANIHLSAITPLTVNLHEDFYTAILKVGFTVLTAASEAVYLNEGTRINVNSMTWLEKKRMQEMIARRRSFRQSIAGVPSELRGDAMAAGIEVIDNGNGDACHLSGYARERKTRQVNANSDAARAAGRDSGVGLQQRRGRWALTYQFLRGILVLLMVIQARVLISVLQKLRIVYRPRWLRRLAGPQDVEKPRRSTSAPPSVRPWTAPDPGLMSDGLDQTGFSRATDVESLAREKARRRGWYDEYGDQKTEELVDDTLYQWWKKGVRWGEHDPSGEYVDDGEDDTTSVMSYASTSAADGSSDLDDGQRTPTQEATWSFSREPTPPLDALVDLSRLSQLLDPKTSEEREEAKLLSRHLQSNKTLTRSQYRKLVETDEAKLLASSRYRLDGLPQGANMTPEEEEKLLEEFILNKRNVMLGGASAAGTWDTGAEGMGSEGPQCVVCQLSPRTVLVWPCGCLSLCDECRVGLASKNYTTCVCCRTNVAAYSRLYVP
ncbi:ubiquitin-protein ligase-like protein [Amniculicola lignicola CBS 123094]|uniref:Ubiquitin-protein ligase-like protein n=1 Tax=Amniculicola lignicola CBS 123094 TaxID=1392246 RepID=A0A6A5VX15_9PLEO|nr:ubiquitin-protein ligase-like protein [Amniculicola lignicola CBS 123094]